MAGESSGSSVDVVVVGAGIAGLVTAWEAARRGCSVVVFEAASSPGGKIAAVDIAGRKVETGPDAFLARVPWAVELCRDLGLETELVAPGTGQAWLWTRDRLRALPTGLVLGVPSRLVPLARSGVLSPRGLVRAAMDEVRARPMPADDMSVTEAIGRHLGQEVVDRLVDPLLGGIFAGSCDRMSMMASAPQLLAPASERRMMRALRKQSAATATSGASAAGAIGARNTGVSTHEQGHAVFLTPRKGMPALVDALAARLPPGALRLGQRVGSLERTSTGWRVNDVDCRSVVLTTPAYVSAELVEQHSSSAAADLAAIPYSSVALALLIYPRAATKLPAGSGMLVPRVDGHLITAASWWDQKWPHRADPDTVVVRASAGRVNDDRCLSLSDDDLGRQLHGELRAAITTAPGCSLPDPIAVHIARWPLAFPQYDVGHLDRVARIEAALQNDAPGLLTTGAAFRGVGLPACIREASALGARLSATN